MLLYNYKPHLPQQKLASRYSEDSEVNDLQSFAKLAGKELISKYGLKDHIPKVAKDYCRWAKIPISNRKTHVFPF